MDIPDIANIPGVITRTTYTIWFNYLTVSKFGQQTGRIGVRIITVRENGVTTIENIYVFRESCE